MHFLWFSSTFVIFLKFLQIKEGVPNFWGEPILHKLWIIWSPLLDWNFKSFVDPNSSSFIRFECILHDSGVLFSESWNFYKQKRGDLISGGNKFCRKSELFGPPFCISVLKVLWTQFFLSFIRFQCILYDSVILFSESCDFYKLKKGEPILQKVWIIWTPLLYFNFKSFVGPNSSSFIRFECILHDFRSTFLRVLKFLQIKEERPNFWGQPIWQKVWIIWSPFVYFSFQSFMDPNSSSFIRFQCILYDSGVLFW